MRDLDRTNPGTWYVQYTRRTLAELLVKRGKLDEAESVYRERLDAYRRVSGSDAPVTLDAMNGLAWLLKDRGPEKLAEAEDLAREATSLARSTLGEGERLTVQVMDTLAVVLYLRGKSEEAVAIFEDVFAVAPTAFGDRWPASISIAHFVEALVELTGSPRPDGIDYEDPEAVLAVLADLYEAWGRPEKAAEFRGLLAEPEPVPASD